MSSSLVKAKLKASREAIQAKDWQSAKEAAIEVLESDSANYHAHVFKALALLNLKEEEESERSYKKAIDLQPAQPLAWQGLEKLYTEREEWAKLTKLWQRGVERALEADDVKRCAELVQQIVAVQREHGAKSELIAALSNYLPESPAFSAIQAGLPVPDQTNPMATSTFEAQMAVHVTSLAVLQEIITLTEEVEKEQMEREVEKRKNRLNSMGKSREELRNEIGLEIWTSSKLPELFEQVLSHLNASDESRREAEHKLLVYRVNILKALPNPTAEASSTAGTSAREAGSEERENDVRERKQSALEQVRTLAEGIVAIDVADELAWEIVLEWQDVLRLTELNRQRLRAYIAHFPRSGLCLALQALLTTIQDAQFVKEQADLRKLHDKDDGVESLPDPLSLALDGIEQAPKSLLTHRIVATLYLSDKDWISSSEVASAGISLARRMEAQLGLSLTLSKASFDGLLAASLTFLHPPQHHSRAIRLCQSILAHDPIDTDALMCSSNIDQAALRWSQAKTTLEQLLRSIAERGQLADYEAQVSLSLFNKPDRDARLDIAWCNVHLENFDEAEMQLRDVIRDMESAKDDADDDSSVKAKAWWRLGQCLWSVGGEGRVDRSGAFTCFITALKKDATFAPAFTSLGLFYADVSQPPDHQRASKCFQKAFELDSRENEAARRLAEVYADEEDWDLVELVARRTIDAEGGAELLQMGKATEQQRRRHTTKNAWAWNAIGSTELVRGNFEKAIVALQVALRSFPTKQEIWMRLGDAYVASDRLSAAIKAYERAGTLQSNEDKWQSMFCIATVQRDLCMYGEALETFEYVARQRKDLLHLWTTCAEVRSSLALQEAREGYVSRAKTNFQMAIVEARRVIDKEPASQAAWKVVSDGLFHFARLSDENSSSDKDFFDHVVHPLIADPQRCSMVDQSLPAISSLTSTFVLQLIAKFRLQDKVFVAAAFICKLRVILLEPHEEIAGSAWMDLGLALQSARTQLSAQASCEDKHTDAMHSQAISCAMEALKSEPGNGMYWSMLGDLVFSHGVALAQHCYIKALESDGGAKDPAAWSSLGLLFLANEDDELARACLVRAQTAEPEYVRAWIGQALIAQRKNDGKGEQSLFRHAYAIDQGDVLEAAYGFASTTHDYARESTRAQIRSAYAALSSFLAERPYDVSALHLSALFAEQLGELDAAAEQIERAATLLEKAYEGNESRQTAQRFAVCMANVGRIYLANGRPEEALEKLEMCLGLLDDEGDEEDGSVGLRASDLVRAKVGAHCGIGLAHHSLGDVDAAVHALQLAIEDIGLAEYESEAQEKLVVLLAQVLYSADRYEEAEATLMDHIDAFPASAEAMTTLGALSWLLDNKEQLEAVQSDLFALSTDTGAPTTLLATLDLYHGRIQNGLERVRPSAHSSLSVHCQLVDVLIRLAALKGQKTAVVEDGDEERSMAAAAAAVAVREADAFYEHVLRRGGGDESGLDGGTEVAAMLRKALHFKAVAATMLAAYHNGQYAAAAAAAAVPRRLAAEAVRLAPFDEKSWQLLHALRS